MGATPIDDNVADGNLANRNIRLISVDYTSVRYMLHDITRLAIKSCTYTV